MRKFSTWMKDVENKKYHGLLSGLALWLGWNVIVLRVIFMMGIIFPLFLSEPYEQICLFFILFYYVCSIFVATDYNQEFKTYVSKENNK